MNENTTAHPPTRRVLMAVTITPTRGGYEAVCVTAAGTSTRTRASREALMHDLQADLAEADSGSPTIGTLARKLSEENARLRKELADQQGPVEFEEEDEPYDF